MNYCPKCGNETAQPSRFCAICGAINPNVAEQPNVITQDVSIKKNGKAKRIVLIASVIAAVIFIMYLIFMEKGIHLKYDWGIEQEEILADGGRISQADSACVLVEDEDHEVDRIKEFEISGNVEYTFIDNKLAAFHYCFNKGKLEFEEMVEIVAGYYGDDYYSDGTHAYWWKNGTVVGLSYLGIMTYWSEELYLKGYSYNSDRVIEYFKK